MATKNEETKKTSTTKTSSNKKSTTNKNTTTKTNSTKKTTQNSNTKKSTTTKTIPKKTTTKSTTKKTTAPKKNTTKKVNKDLEKTIVIKDIENKISNIVENKNVEVKEQVIKDIKIENVAKLENAKYEIKKRNKQLLAVGVIISLLGIVALIITLIANRMVDKQFISDNAIMVMVVASILIEIFGAFIIINES